MRQIGLWAMIVAAAVGLGLSAAQGQTRQNIWLEDLTTARRIAAETNRLVLIHFWAEWCRPCRQMEAEVFSRPDVLSAIASSYVAVKLNFDRNTALAQQLGVESVPTDIIMTPGGEILQKSVGGVSAQRFIERVNQVAFAWQQRQSLASQMAPPAVAPIVPASPPPAAPPVQFTQNPGPANPNPIWNLAPQTPPPPQVPVAMGPSTPSVNPPNMGWSIPPEWSQPAQPSASSYAPAKPQPAVAAGPNPYWGNAAGPSPGSVNQPATPTPSAPDFVAAQGAPPTSFGGPVASSSVPPQMGAAGFDASSGPVGSPTSLPASPGLATAGLPSDPNRQGGNFPASSPNFPAPGPSGQVPSSPMGDLAGLQGIPQGAGALTNANSAGQAGASTLELPPGNPPLGLEGYCPVSLTDKRRWVLGNRRWGVRHEGRTYLFAGPEEQQKFLANPDRYAPVLSGYDVVRLVEGTQLAEGRREHGAWFGGRVYLFSDEESFQKFNADPYRYINALPQAVAQLSQQVRGQLTGSPATPAPASPVMAPPATSPVFTGPIPDGSNSRPTAPVSPAVPPTINPPAASPPGEQTGYVPFDRTPPNVAAVPAQPQGPQIHVGLPDRVMNNLPSRVVGPSAAGYPPVANRPALPAQTPATGSAPPNFPARY